jgi:flagellar basal-body rod protein FlgB
VELGPVADQLGTYLDLLAARQRQVASNIANVDTPDYKAKDIDFQFEFLAAMGSDQQKSGQPVQPEIFEVPGLLTKNDGNNVSLDREARLLAENSIRFNLASTLFRAEVRQIRNAIQEGKGGL